MTQVIAERFDVDVLGNTLEYLGAFGRAMPPSWDGARISIPVGTPNDGFIGRILPGRGFYLDSDLKEVGITRRVPRHVFERSPIQWLADMLGDERGAITSYDQIVSARGSGLANDMMFSKNSITTVALAWSTLFRAGGTPAAGTYTNIPGGAVHTRASTGAWSQGLTNPTSGRKKYLLTFGHTSASQIQYVLLVDLLVACGNINANATGNQTVNSTALTRQHQPTHGATAGAGVMMIFDITTALGGTAANLTVNSYTDQDGNAAATTAAAAMTQSGITHRLQPASNLTPLFDLASGDYGVRSVETVVMSAAMGAGVIALNLYFPLMMMPGIAANVFIERDSTVQVDGISELAKDGSNVIGCLTAYACPNTTASGVYVGFMRSCEG
jgi:hypothetical protein